MANTTNHNSVKLTDRTLWFDGSSTISADSIIDKVLSGCDVSYLYVDKITPDIEQYNKFTDGHKKIGIKTDVNIADKRWNIPDEYATLDVLEYVLTSTDFDIDAPDAEHRCQRVIDEIALYEEYGLMDVLRVLIFIINTLNHSKVMWGVGRGSSVSSYVLYLIGVHDIDSVKYELDITDFLRSA